MATFLERVKELRISHGLTQKQAAECTGVGLRHWQKYEGEERTPTYERLLAIADFFDVSTDYLLGLTDVPERR